MSFDPGLFLSRRRHARTRQHHRDAVLQVLSEHLRRDVGLSEFSSVGRALARRDLDPLGW